MDSAGAAYVAGVAGAQFPVTVGAAYQTGNGFALKLSPGSLSPQLPRWTAPAKVPAAWSTSPTPQGATGV